MQIKSGRKNNHEPCLFLIFLLDFLIFFSNFDKQDLNYDERY